MSYARFISLVLIIMSYGATQPFLYICGAILCVEMYWSDKIMFVCCYKRPPRMKATQAQSAVRAMKFGAILHILFGFFLFCQPHILTYPQAEDDSENWAPWLTQDLSRVFGGVLAED